VLMRQVSTMDERRRVGRGTLVSLARAGSALDPEATDRDVSATEEWPQ